tara:strand:- start:10737 stop:11915 length:1179 start_codon:yes stop_codon:yes gene_type:complete
MILEYTWRWYGPNDTITLNEIRQCGATGIVNALHESPYGEVWSVEAILERKKIIEDAGLSWSVVESVPVHEDIKKKSGSYLTYIENYKNTIRNLADCGIYTVCYNFMPVLDWIRTNLDFKLENDTYALRFDATTFAAFDLFILERIGANNDYSQIEIDRAKSLFNSFSDQDIKELTDTLIAGIPGGKTGYTVETVRDILHEYKDISTELLQSHLTYFLEQILPVAEESGVLMCIHPDDPPYPFLGLPRIMSTNEDVDRLMRDVPSKNNGITLCTGSYGVRPENDLVAMATKYADRIHFLHFRSVQREPDGSFYEAEHLKGDSGIVKIMHAILSSDTLASDHAIPVRPDHGHKMLDDISKNHYPGYSCFGRLKGLSELKGMEQGLRFNLIKDN